MALLDILVYPDPRLWNKALPVEVFDATLGKLVEDMAETMYTAPGIGLAATQVNVAKRVVVIDTSEHQDRLQLREALLVGFFLAGLVTLGGFQKWWLQPLISQLGELPLFLGATALTAITDNAALTYLGSLVEGLKDADKYALVAGAVAGGGLTVIANAPNPAGFGILKSSFGEEGISPLGLLIGALAPTIVVMVCLWFLPSL